ncbi:restriction endonuclease subunit S [Dactylosporangium sp. CA-092794]|uniref:restriction endonuclease subunit S n=1 Tax=Dactylosporangium sp. CA-092794 TaxID=3239929 RepID=UPI003D8CEDA1
MNWPVSWRSAPLWSLFDRIKDVGHPDEEMLSVYRNYGVVRKDDRKDNYNKTAENRDIYQLIDQGWLIVNRMKAWQGAVGISPYRGIVSGHYICFRPRHGEDAQFLNWLLRSDAYTYEYARLSRGVRPNQIEIDNELLRNLSVHFPSIDEQRRIADFLDTEVGRIDRLAVLRQGQSMRIQERYSAALSEYVIPGITVDSARSQSWPWLPDTTPLARLGYLARVQNGVTVHGARVVNGDEVEVPYLRVANVQGERLDLAEIKHITLPQEMALRSTLRAGDVVMTEANGNPDNLGRGALWCDEIPGMVHQNHIFAIRTDYAKLLPEFLVALLASIHGRCYFRMTSSQVGIATTSSSKVLDFPVPVFTLVQQRQAIQNWRDVREETNRLVAALDAQFALLAERRRALVTAAVTGQIDVSTASGRGIED